MMELTHRNTRRYGGYMVHVGMVIMFIGFTGKAFDQDTTVEIAAGRHDFAWAIISSTLMDIQQGQNDNYRWQKIIVDVDEERRESRHAGAGEAVISCQEGTGEEVPSGGG